jgi:hypothetical protein
VDAGKAEEPSAHDSADHADDGVNDAASEPDVAPHENGGDPSSDEADEKEANDLDVDTHCPRNSSMTGELGKLIAPESLPL